jgi:hypothetical protein
LVWQVIGGSHNKEAQVESRPELDHRWPRRSLRQDGVKVHDKVKVTGKVTQTEPNLAGALKGPPLLIGFRLDGVKPAEP